MFAIILIILIIVGVVVILIKYPALFGMEDWYIKDTITITFNRKTPKVATTYESDHGTTFETQKFLGTLTITYEFKAYLSTLSVLKWKSHDFISREKIIDEWNSGKQNELFKRDILPQILSDDFQKLLSVKIPVENIHIEYEYKETEEKQEEHYRKYTGDA